MVGIWRFAIAVVFLFQEPVITNPLGSKTLKEDDTNPKTLKRIELKKYDEEADCTMTDDDDGPFAIDGTVAILYMLLP